MPIGKMIMHDPKEPWPEIKETKYYKHQNP